MALREEAGAPGQILYGIASERHFTEGEQVCTGLMSSAGGIHHLCCVACEVSDNRVSLRKRQAKSGHSH